MSALQLLIHRRQIQQFEFLHDAARVRAAVDRPVHGHPLAGRRDPHQLAEVGTAEGEEGRDPVALSKDVFDDESGSAS